MTRVNRFAKEKLRLHALRAQESHHKREIKRLKKMHGPTAMHPISIKRQIHLNK